MTSIRHLLYVALLTLPLACGNTSNDMKDTASNTSNENFNEDSETHSSVQDSGTTQQPEDATSEGADTAGVCLPESMSCDNNILMECTDGVWQQRDDCSVDGKRCTVRRGEFQCVSFITNPDTGSDGDIETDEGPLSSDDTDTLSPSDSESESLVDSDSGALVDSETAHPDTGDTATVGSDTDTSTHETDSDTVADTASTAPIRCDGPDVSCYSECWECAQSEGLCNNELLDCYQDVGCVSYTACIDEICCGGENDCLTGAAWEDCMRDCAENAGATDETLELYHAIDKCIACDACAISCGQNESQDFAMCAEVGGGINTANSPCYERDANPGEIACFSWASWSGPCSTAAISCQNSEKCDALDACISNTYSADDVEASQATCFDAAGPTAEAQYWAFQQCIYCDLCDVACIDDAATKHCDEYMGK